MSGAPALARFVGLAEALELQRRLCDRFGGDPEPADPGVLEGALARCRSPHYATLAEQAAALLHGLAGQGAMRTANDRFAFALAATFLRLNGQRIEVAPRAALHFLREHVHARNAGVPRISKALERVLVPA